LSQIQQTEYESTHATIQEQNHIPIKLWNRGLPELESQAMNQLRKTAQLPIIHPQGMAVMPDCHWGIGATIGSVIPTTHAIVPAAVGVDLGCGMIASLTTLTANQLPDNLSQLRYEIEAAIPHGRTSEGNASNDRGAWNNSTTALSAGLSVVKTGNQSIPDFVVKRYRQELNAEFQSIASKHKKIGKGNLENHLGTLGTGNHFIEVCLDESDRVWLMLHSGSRGVGNRIGMYFIELAKKDMGRVLSQLPDRDLAYFTEGTQHFDDYVEAVSWAQKFARMNREVMMELLVNALKKWTKMNGIPDFKTHVTAVNCHHNYVSRETHFGESMLITRKGAVRADKGMLGIIPGSMGASSFIVRGKGNPHSYNTCSHGAGRLMSRKAARLKFTVKDHEKATLKVECRKDSDVIDETPAAYKPIELVMEAQKDLVEVVHTLRQIVCVKG